MRSHYGSMLKILVIAVFVFAVGSVDVFCKKKEMDIEISVVVGLSDGNYICRVDSWTPIYILLDNKEIDLDGYFELKSPDDDRVYQIPFTSPKNSKFLIPSYIRVSGGEGKNEYTLTMHTSVMSSLN